MLEQISFGKLSWPEKIENIVRKGSGQVSGLVEIPYEALPNIKRHLALKGLASKLMLRYPIPPSAAFENH